MWNEVKYKFGNTVFAVRSQTNLLADDRYEAFRTDAEADFVYEISEDAYSGVTKTVIPVEECGNIFKVYCKNIDIGRINIAGLLCGVDAANLLTKKDSFILHASCVYYEGKAILFTAPSQTGKSTQARFWREKRGAEIVNEDRVIISKSERGYLANGCWAKGSGEVCKNITAPIRAVVMLGQGSKNIARNAQPNEIIRRIVPQCTFNENSITEKIRIIDLVSDMLNYIPIVAYDCVKHESSVDELEKYI